MSVAYDGDEPAELYDPVSHYGGQRQIVCRPNDIAFEGWLAPVYDGLPEFVVGLPVPMRAWVELVATCNRHSTQSTVYLGGHPFREPATGAFAAACRFGGGYLVLITGSVSDDVWAEAFPGNLEWLTRLGNHLVERVRIDRRLNAMTHQVFVSHSWTDHGFATTFGDELRRRGFGTWVDSRELLVGDDLPPALRRSIDESSHFALIWSAACARSKWVVLELDHALASGKRIFLVRLDETSVPPAVANKLRIEAQAIPATEAARLVALSVEKEERGRRPDPGAQETAAPV